ncbi:MAG: hypothetical protein KJ050_09610 [Candidatus Omnitrophica bacterium]|nr:MAG: hypothetical protein UZ16_OP3001000589 [Candidatus Hinthialibacteria bacterium OLB16]MCC6732301.1 hypothetical protein [Candidatus Omnitrophota bacterium]MCK6496689.1 hypothetical protein [bacterium]MCL4735178.1 hypothetical protein [Candidatus Omnitrophota bacterium]NUP91605.1 hypothetical protein [Candidatus Omnitrophota bacterium]
MLCSKKAALARLFLLGILIISVSGDSACGFGAEPRPGPVQYRPLMLDPVFIPSKMADTFHMNPMVFYGNDFLKPGEFDFDLAIGTFGTDFSKAESLIWLEEDTDWAVYSDYAWRFGLTEEVGPLTLPIELVTQIPLFFSTGGMTSSFRPNMATPWTQVDEVEDDGVAMGKWVWGLRMGLIQESHYLPSLSLQTSVGIPVDRELASSGVDYDVRLNFQKYFCRGITGTLYGGILFPGDGRDIFNDLGIREEDNVPYFGLMTDINFAQLCGSHDPGRVWLHLGGSWREAVYDFGSEGPDYAEEEVKLTAGLTVDLGYWGRRIGCPQGMLGVSHNAAGGPEEGEFEFYTRLNFPFEFD